MISRLRRKRYKDVVSIEGIVQEPIQLAVPLNEQLRRRHKACIKTIEVGIRNLARLYRSTSFIIQPQQLLYHLLINLTFFGTLRSRNAFNWPSNIVLIKIISQ